MNFRESAWQGNNLLYHLLFIKRNPQHLTELPDNNRHGNAVKQPR